MYEITQRLENLREYLKRNMESLQQKVDGRTSNVNFEDDTIELSLTGRQLEFLHDSLFVWIETMNNNPYSIDIDIIRS